MAGALKFDGLPDYSTKDPVRLRVELQRQNAKVAEGFTRAQAQFEPIPVERQLNPNEEVNGLFGEAYLCDTTGASVVTVYLPEVQSTDVGKYIDVAHIRTGGVVRIRPWGDQTIQGATVLSISGSIGFVRLRAFTCGPSPGSRGWLRHL